MKTEDIKCALEYFLVFGEFPPDYKKRLKIIAKKFGSLKNNT